MQTVNIKTRCQTCKEDMDKVLLEKIAVLEKALELACKSNVSNMPEEQCVGIEEYFKEQARKEIMKSE